MADAGSGPFVHRLDALDRITDVNEAWVTFALENGAVMLTAAAVVGQSLWDYVVGDAPKHIYRQLFKQVRDGREITLPFRCDSPTVRRYHEMRIVGIEDAGIECQCRLLRQEVQDPGPVTLLDPGVFRSDLSVLMCAWCKRVKAPSGDWLALEQAIVVLQLLAQTPPPAVTHGICPSCRSALGAAQAPG